MSEQLSDRQLSGFKKAFTIFDKDGSGTISATELAIAIKSLGHSVSDSDLLTMIEEVDPGNDGQQIDFQSFVSIMMRNIHATQSSSSSSSKQNKKEFIKSMSSSSSSSSTTSSPQIPSAIEEDDITVNTESETVYTQEKSIKSGGGSRKSVGSTGSNGTTRSRGKKSSLLPSRGTKVWALGEDNEWGMGLLEKVKKPVIVNERKVVALHVLMDELPPANDDEDDVEEDPEAKLEREKELEKKRHKVILTHYETEDETEYVMVKRTGPISSGNANMNSTLLKKLDISILSVINEPELLHFLRSRYNEECRFFGIGPLMLAFTVHRRSGSIENGGHSLMKDIPYFANNDVMLNQEVGVCGLAHRMCARLCPLTGSSGVASSGVQLHNQTVLLQGESGSGKSTLVRELSQHIVGALANSIDTPLSEVKISDDVLQDMNCILETFGHAQTFSNPNSSRYSKSIKFSVDGSGGGSVEGEGGLRGVLVRCYSLELNRVSHCPEGDCNFNVFYDVFDDIFFSDIAFEKFDIEDITSFKYTPQKPISRLNEPGKSPFRDLTRALLKLLDLPKRDHRVLFGVLAAILHLGEVQLVQDDQSDDDDPSVSYSEDESSMKHVDIVCKLLGLTHSALLTILTKRHVNFAGTVVAKHLSLADAIAARDAVASQLYLAVFKWLVSSMNTALHKKFMAQHIMFGEQKEDVDEPERDEEEFDMLACKNVIALYDFPGFEYAKPSNISGLCKNFINEKVYQYYSRNLFTKDSTCFADVGLSVPPLSLTNNFDIINMLDNKSNGIFTIFNDQMKLKSRQLDAKVASVLYSHHSNSQHFDGGKKERKRLWFKVRHYNFSVSYEVKGFKNINKIQPSAEMVEFLRSSTVPYVKGLLSYCEVRSSLVNPHLHGLEAAPAVEQAVSEVLEKSMSRGFSSRKSFQSTPSTRNFMIQHQTSDVVSVYSVGQDDESVTSLSSKGSRKGGSGKPVTMASLTQTFMQEVITEISASQSHFILCMKPNDVNTCKDFDNYTVSRQLSPYEIQKVLRFYHTAFPYRMTLSEFSNRYSILSTVHKISGSLSKAFTKMLLKCRALGSNINIKQSHNLIKSLLNLVSNLPELEAQFSPLSDKKTGDFYFEAVQTGLKVCDDCVLLTALAHFYLEAAHKIALTLVAHLFQRFYRQRVRPLVEFQIEKVKRVCRGFVARKSWAKKRLAVVKIQSVIRMFVIKSHYEYERQVLRSIIRAQAHWRGKLLRLRVRNSPPVRPAWMDQRKGQLRSAVSKDFVTPMGEDDERNQYSVSPPGEGLDFTPHPRGGSKMRNQPHIKKSYTTEEEDSRSNDEEEGDDLLERDGFVDPLDERGASQFMHKNNPRVLNASSSSSSNSIGAGANGSKHELKKISELQSQLNTMKQENKALRKVEKKFIQQSKSLSNIDEEAEEEDEKHLGNRSHIIHRQNTANDMKAERLRCAYDNDGTRLLPDYDLYSARVLNAVQDDLSFLLKPTVFFKFGHQGSVRKALICVSPCFHYIMWKPKNSLFKKSEQCKVDLRKVWNLAKGQTTPAFKEYKGITHGPMPPKLSFSLIFGFRSLDFCALDEETYRLWIQGLQYIVELINGESKEAGIDKQYYRSQWNLLDKNRNGVLTRKNIISLVASLGVKFTNDSFLTAILRSSIGNSRLDQVTFSQFSSLMYQLTRRPDLEIIWASLLSDDSSDESDDVTDSINPLHATADSDATTLFDVIGVGKFRKFWKRHQGRQLSHNEARMVIKEGMGEKVNSNFPVLSYAGFQAIMNHEKNDVYDPLKTHFKVSEMSHPLNHYYISSSDGPVVGVKPHRLTISDDSDNPYSVDIRRGCRCLELRCFEGDIALDDVDQRHGYRTDLFVSTVTNEDIAKGTAGTRLTLKETLWEISRVAFSFTHFPLIILLEFSGSVNMQLQARAAKYLEKVFGDALFTPSDVSSDSTTLPAPKYLKKRVLVFLTSRTKNINEAYSASVTDVPSRGRSSRNGLLNRQESDDTGSYMAKEIENVDDVLDWQESPMSSPMRSQSKRISRDVSSNASSFYNSLPPMSPPKTRKRSPPPTKPTNIHDTLYNICHHADLLFRLSSHSMSTVVSKIKSDPDGRELIQEYNAHQMSYVFMDDQVKVDGSFGRMVQLWDFGVPCISLCHHLPSLATKLHHGKFRANGGCGFVPKPQSLRSLNNNPDAKVDSNEDPDDESEAFVLIVHVISGQELPDLLPDIPFSDLIANSVGEESVDSPSKNQTQGHGFSVVLNMNDAILPIENIEQKTRSVRAHGRNPFWNEVFTFAVQDLNRGQLTLRVFCNDYCQGFASIPLGCIRRGYRTVSLFHEDEGDNFVIKQHDMSSLFVRVSLSPASEFSDIRQITRSASDVHSSPMRVIKQSKSFSAAAFSASNGKLQDVTALPAECGVIQGIPPLNPVKGNYHFQPTPLAVKSAVALRTADVSSADMEEKDDFSPSLKSPSTDYRKFNLYGQRSMDGIRTPQEAELDSFEELQRSISRSYSSGRSARNSPFPSERDVSRQDSYGSTSSPYSTKSKKLSSRVSSDEYSSNRQGLESVRGINVQSKSSDTFYSSGDYDNEGGNTITDITDDIISDVGPSDIRPREKERPKPVIVRRRSSGSSNISNQVSDDKMDTHDVDIVEDTLPTSRSTREANGSVNDHSEQSVSRPKAHCSSSSRSIHSVDSHSRMSSKHSHNHSSHSLSRDRHADDDDSTSSRAKRVHRRSASQGDTAPLRYHHRRSHGSSDSNLRESRDRESVSTSKSALLSPVPETKSNVDDDDEIVSLHSFDDDSKMDQKESSSRHHHRSHSNSHSRSHSHGHSSHNVRHGHSHGHSSHSLHHHHSRSGHGHSSRHDHHRHHSSSSHSLTKKASNSEMRSLKPMNSSHGHSHRSHHTSSAHDQDGDSRSRSRGRMHRHKSSRSSRDDHSVDIKELGEREKSKGRDMQRSSSKRQGNSNEDKDMWDLGI